MKIIIIGGVAAGAKAAAKSRRMLTDESEVIIYTDDNFISYSSCGISTCRTSSPISRRSASLSLWY